MTTNQTIQGLWVGSRLSPMEELSIASFLRNGHRFDLYVYGEVENVPEGTTVRDAGEILPQSAVFQYKERKSFSGFSNFFRYKLLLERGGWWVDVDTVCLKPFDFEESYVFSSEPHGEHNEREVINCGIIKVPPASAVMSYAWDVCSKKDVEKIVWGETGPRLMIEAVHRYDLQGYAKPYTTFCPLAAPHYSRVLDPEASLELDETTYAIHLWNEMWRRNDEDKSRPRHPDCFYERLKRRYLG